MTDGDHEEILRLRERMHELTAAIGGLQIEVALLKHGIEEARAESSREIEELRDDNKALRRGVYTLSFSAVTAAIVAVLSLGIHG